VLENFKSFEITSRNLKMLRPKNEAENKFELLTAVLQIWVAWA
jgi:hypothetical protein